MRILSNLKQRVKYLKFTALLLGKRSKIIKPLIVSNPEHIFLENNVRIKEGARIECYKEFFNQKLSPKLVIGKKVIIGYNFSCLVTDEITIGENTIIASNVLITSENHGINPESEIPYYEQELINGKVSIGSGCWVGERVIILPDVSIGKKCIIAAGSIVTKSVPDYSMVAGVPARVIKQYNFEEHKWIKV